MNRLLNQHRFDALLGVSILCLAGLLHHRRATLSRAEDAAKAQPRAETEHVQHPVHAPSTKISMGSMSLIGEGWHEATAAHPLRRKSAIRLVECRDAFLVSIATCNLDTNSVRVALKGSLLTIAARSGNGGGVESHNCFMLPVSVDATVAPEVWLADDLLQIRIAKPRLASLSAEAALSRF